MKIITARDRIRTVAQRWRGTYGQGRYGADKLVILAALSALDPETATAAEVNKIIGNASWTRDFCSECGTSSDWTVQVGQEPDYESSTADLCRNCAVKLVDLLQADGIDSRPAFHPV